MHYIVQKSNQDVSVSVSLSTARFFAVKSFKILSLSNWKYIKALLLGIVTLIINGPKIAKYAEQDSKPNHSDYSLCSNPQTCFLHENSDLLYCGVCC